jgi:hypothetical protein
VIFVVTKEGRQKIFYPFSVVAELVGYGMDKN